MAAAYAFESGYHVVDFHPCHKPAYALEITVASVGKLHLLHDSIFHLNVNQPRASALCSVLIFHMRYQMILMCRKITHKCSLADKKSPEKVESATFSGLPIQYFQGLIITGLSILADGYFLAVDDVETSGE